MMEFNFKELVAKAHFDYIGPFFPSWWATNKTKFVLPSLNNIGRELLLGGKYFQTLKVSYHGKEYIFPNEPLISLSLSKTIIETPTIGKERIGTVKEYICTEDYQITIRGVCVNEKEPELYPTAQVQELKNMFLINDRLNIENNPFLELFEIRGIVLKDISLEEMAGEQGLQKYTIDALSDNDFYADLKEKEKIGNLLNILG